MPIDNQESGAMEQNSAGTAKPVRIPGPDHPITIKPNPNRVVISVDGRVIADTVHALTLREADYPPVQYIPREDVDMALLDPSDHQTYCPYKGDCSYFSIANEDKGVNAVWSYEMPFPAVSPIQGHLAFYQDRVDYFEGRPGRVAPHRRFGMSAFQSVPDATGADYRANAGFRPC